MSPLGKHPPPAHVRISSLVSPHSKADDHAEMAVNLSVQPEHHKGNATSDRDLQSTAAAAIDGSPPPVPNPDTGHTTSPGNTTKTPVFAENNIGGIVQFDLPQESPPLAESQNDIVPVQTKGKPWARTNRDKEYDETGTYTDSKIHVVNDRDEFFTQVHAAEKVKQLAGITIHFKLPGNELLDIDVNQIIQNGVRTNEKFADVFRCPVDDCHQTFTRRFRCETHFEEVHPRAYQKGVRARDHPTLATFNYHGRNPGYKRRRKTKDQAATNDDSPVVPEVDFVTEVDGEDSEDKRSITRPNRPLDDGPSPGALRKALHIAGMSPFEIDQQVALRVQAIAAISATLPTPAGTTPIAREPPVAAAQQSHSGVRLPVSADDAGNDLSEVSPRDHESSGKQRTQSQTGAQQQPHEAHRVHNKQQPPVVNSPRSLDADVGVDGTPLNADTTDQPRTPSVFDLSPVPDKGSARPQPPLKSAGLDVYGLDTSDPNYRERLDETKSNFMDASFRRGSIPASGRPSTSRRPHSTKPSIQTHSGQSNTAPNSNQPPPARRPGSMQPVRQDHSAQNRAALGRYHYEPYRRPLVRQIQYGSPNSKKDLLAWSKLAGVDEGDFYGGMDSIWVPEGPIPPAPPQLPPLNTGPAANVQSTSGGLLGTLHQQLNPVQGNTPGNTFGNTDQALNHERPRPLSSFVDRPLNHPGNPNIALLNQTAVVSGQNVFNVGGFMLVNAGVVGSGSFDGARALSGYTQPSPVAHQNHDMSSGRAGSVNHAANRPARGPSNAGGYAYTAIRAINGTVNRQPHVHLPSSTTSSPASDARLMAHPQHESQPTGRDQARPDRDGASPPSSLPTQRQPSRGPDS